MSNYARHKSQARAAKAQARAEQAQAELAEAETKAGKEQAAAITKALTADRDRAEVSRAGGHGTAVLRALIRDPAMAVLVRPDRVVAAIGSRAGLPGLPWSIPAGPVSRPSWAISSSPNVTSPVT